MFERIRIQNYRCLRDLTFDLSPFTVFVGPNASGKTALADALTATTTSSSDRWRHKGGRSQYLLGLDEGQAMRMTYEYLPGNRKKYDLDPRRVRAAEQANEVWKLEPDGAQLANLFDTLTRADQARFVADFVRLVPVYADIKARARNGTTRLQFQDLWDPSVWYEPDQVSDGTVLTAAFVALGYQREVPDLAVFEDPDHGLHPYLQQHVVELLRGLSRGEIGPRAIQIVCTTHSKAFLDHVEPHEVRFLSRDAGTGETRVRPAPVGDPNWKQIYDQYQQSLGDMWLTGALGGVPGS